MTIKFKANVFARIYEFEDNTEFNVRLFYFILFLFIVKYLLCLFFKVVCIVYEKDSPKRNEPVHMRTLLL